MERFWRFIAVELGKHAGLVSVIGLLVTLILGFGITRLEFSTGQDSYLNKSDTVYKDNVKYQNLFGGQAMLTLVTMDKGHTVNELFTPANQAKFRALEDQLHTGKGVVGVISPRTIMEFSDSLVQSPTGDPTQSVAGRALVDATTRDPSPEGQQARNADAATTIQRLNAVPQAERTLDNPAWIDFLLHNNQGQVRKALKSFIIDDRHAQVVTRLVGNASITTEGAASDYVKEQAGKLRFDNASVITTGAPVLLKDINDYLTGGMLTLGAIAIAIMIVILLVLFDVRWRLLPMAVILIGIVWAFGLAGYLGIPLTIVTIAGLPVMLGIGIDYAIQMHARVEEEVVIDREAHPIQETARNLCPALLVVTFDAIFAFAALRFAKVPMLRQFGLLLAVGIAVICLCSIVVPLATLGIREYKSPTKGRDFRTGPLGRLVVWLGSLPGSIAIYLTVASVIIFAGGILVEGKLVLQTDPIKWVNQNSQVIHDLNTLDRETGSSSELGMFVQSKDVFDDKTVQFMDGFTTQQLADHPETLLTGAGIVTTVSDITNDIPGTSHVSPTGDEVRAADGVAPVDVKKSAVSSNGDALNLVFRTGPSELERRAAVVREIRSTVEPPPGVSATPSGLAVVGVGLLDNLEANRVLLTYLSILFVFLFLSVRLRSVIRSLLSLVPVLIAVGTASLVAYAFSLKLSPVTAVGGPLVVAACTEFTSLILLRFVEERRRGLTPEQSVEVAASRTGRAFIVSALTAISGVAVIATSSLPLLRDFGIIVAMNVAVALLSALVVLPPMLVWADRRNWVSRGLVKREILERTAAGEPPPEPEPAPAPAPS
ncbi:MAG TPA: MMPL family transporter [Acidimicrobiia bacterium]|nr:MMPL family transporter [Acidimicrobiia bacterium]